MKKFNYIIGALVAGAMAFTSCNLNNSPKFNDADAFIAFTKTTMDVTENGGSLDVPLLLTSLAGLEGTAVVEVDTVKSTAKEGVHFTIEGSSVSFTKEAPTQQVKLNIIDNEVFGGDVKVVLAITSTTGVNLGAVNTCTVTISDDEHPLKPILGNYNAYSYTGLGEYTYSVSLTMDPSDVQLVWINDIEPYFGSYGYLASKGYNKFYGIVNEDLTQITIPAKQKLGYENTEIVACDIQSQTVLEGEDIIIEIKDGGKILEFVTPWGIYDEGWWNIAIETILTKQ